MSDIFGPIKRKRIAEELVSEIKSNILKKNLKPGDRLPDERTLASLCRVSRNTVREALITLENEGLLEIKPGKDGGAFITHPSDVFVENVLNGYFRFGDVTMDDVSRARLIIEPEIAKYVAIHRSEDDLKEIKSVIDANQNLIERKLAYIETQKDFHILLAKLTQNPILMIFTNSLMKYIAMKYIAKDKSSQKRNYELIEKDQEFHQKIYEAIKEKDGNKAYRLMVEHINNIFGIEKLTAYDTVRGGISLPLKG